MMQNYYPYVSQMMSGYGYGTGFGGLMILLLLWTLPWKGYALWIAARKGSSYWFIALLLLNTLAILDILYIFVFSKPKAKEIK